jgi:hypothetical protein
VLVAPIDRVMNEDVFPWVFDKMLHFLEDEDIVGVTV